MRLGLTLCAKHVDLSTDIPNNHLILKTDSGFGAQYDVQQVLKSIYVQPLSSLCVNVTCYQRPFMNTSYDIDVGSITDSCRN
ncbi:hypothetical protein P7K49_017439 [Saguinus oedipus]|uniref:Uncharacterized protein n=1 Tax=Saguinus oedipus TaxID=9490 RepID=A0ABQ9V4F0_SAGOE|nr:hypothetical protein P7K49_017439 [Saguinus oedipus]